MEVIIERSGFHAVPFSEWKRLGSARAVLAIMICVHGMLLAVGAWHHSPVTAEVQQIPAGLYQWEYGRSDFAEVNPPLVRLVASLPLTLISPKVDWRGHEREGLIREEYKIGAKFVEINGRDCQRLFFVSRIACIPFSLIGLFFCWRWGRLLYGELAGLISASLWCFSPFVLGHAQLVSADIAGAAMGVMATYYVQTWLSRGHWTGALVAGGAIGAAVATKFTLLLLFPLVPIWAAIFAITRPVGHMTWSARLRRHLLQTTIVFGAAIYIVNLAYFFDGSPFQPREVFFKSQALQQWGASPLEDIGQGRSGSYTSHLWIPLPKSFFRGLDQQKYDFESPHLSFMHGQWKKGGWWSYYLYALGIKTPLGTLALGALAVLAFAFPQRLLGRRVSWQDEFILLSLMFSIFLLVSSQNNMSCHVRYIFPLLGALFVLFSRSALLLQLGSRSASTVVGFCLAWSAASALYQYPHNIGYFHELVGAKNGHLYLSHSNVNWGQDLYYLKQWQDDNSEARPLFLESDAIYDPAAFGIDYVRTRDMTEFNISGGSQAASGPRPGWHAISRQRLSMQSDWYRYLRNIDPVSRVGSGLHLYHLSVADANAVREELGLPQLPADWEQRYHEGKRMEAVLAAELAGNIASFDAKVFKPKIGVLAFRYNDLSNDEEEIAICGVLEREMGCDCDVVTVESVKSVGLGKYDVIIVPGGASELMAEQLGRDGRGIVRKFVASGGGYLGICAGSFLAMDRFEHCLNLVEASVLDGPCETLHGTRSRMTDRGAGTITVKMTEVGQRLFATDDASFSASYTGGPVLQDDVLDGIPTYATLATYRSEIWKCLAQRGTMVQSPSLIAARFEKGRVILFGFHPEESLHSYGVLLSSIKALVPTLRADHRAWGHSTLP